MVRIDWPLSVSTFHIQQQKSISLLHNINYRWVFDCKTLCIIISNQPLGKMSTRSSDHIATLNPKKGTADSYRTTSSAVKLFCMCAHVLQPLQFIALVIYWCQVHLFCDYLCASPSPAKTLIQRGRSEQDKDVKLLSLHTCVQVKAGRSLKTT